MIRTPKIGYFLRFLFVVTGVFLYCAIGFANTRSGTPTSPILAYRDAESIKAYARLDLRPPAELRKILAATRSRPPSVSGNWGGLKKPLSEKERSDLIALVIARIPDLQAKYDKVVSASTTDYTKRARLRSALRWAHVIIGNAGKETDLASLEGGKSEYLHFQTVGYYLNRVGHFADGTIDTTLAAEQLSFESGTAAFYRYLALAQHGSSVAGKKLMEIRREKILEFAKQNLEINDVARAAAVANYEGTTGFMHKLISIYREQVKEIAAGERAFVDYRIGRAVPWAVVHIAAYEEDKDRVVLSGLPLLKGSLEPIIYASAADPAKLIRFLFGEKRKLLYEETAVIKGGRWPIAQFAAALVYRSPTDRQQFEEQALSSAVNAALTYNTYKSNGRDHISAQATESAFAIGLTRLKPSPVAGKFLINTDSGENFAKWFKDIPWAVSRFRVEGAMQKLVNSKSYFNDIGLDYFDEEVLRQAMGSRPVSISDHGDLFFDYHRTITRAYRVPIEIGKAERLAFVRQFDGDYEKVALTGVVEISPRLTGKTLKIGIRMQLRVSDEGGLGSAISGRAKKINLLLSEFGRHILKSVRWDRGNDTTGGLMQSAQTTSNGVHVFETDLDVPNLNNLYLRINLDGFGDQWRLDIPLFDSHYVYRSNLGK